MEEVWLRITITMEKLNTMSEIIPPAMAPSKVRALAGYNMFLIGISYPSSNPGERSSM